MKRVLGIGNALVDMIIMLTSDAILNYFKLPKGSMQLVDATSAITIEKACSKLNKIMASGGSAANTIHGLSHLGVSTAFLGTIGNDDMGNFFYNDLKNAGILPLLSKINIDTGRAISLVSPDSERTFATFLGAASQISESQLKNEIFKEYDILYLEGYLVQQKPFIEAAIKKARDHNMLVVLDLASYNVVESNVDFLKEIVDQYIDIIFANEEEASAYTGKKDPLEALHQLASVTQIAIVKTGEKGSFVQKDNHVYQIGVIKARAIDTTGAGDLYAAGFLYGYIHGLSLQKCGAIGALLAGNVIENLGAKIQNSRWNEIQCEIKKIQQQSE
jgi:sugar/nucleoside kinase (ribokinase family)